MFIDSPTSADMGLISAICGGGRVHPGFWLPRRKSVVRIMRERVMMEFECFILVCLLSDFCLNCEMSLS